MNVKSITLILLIVIGSITLSGCAPGHERYSADNPAGFFWGIWHGWIAPISLIWGLFNPSIRIYETDNIGWWYDLGFYVAIIGGFGGLSLFRQSRKSR